LKGPTADLSQQVTEAGGSLTLGTQGAGGSSLDNDGTGRHRQTARARQARRNGARRLNQWWNPLKRRTPARNLVDLGRTAAGRSSKLPMTGSAMGATPTSRWPWRKPAAYPWRRLQGKSWAPPPSIGREVNVGTDSESPFLPVGSGQARRQPMAPRRGGVRVVVGGRESRSQGEGGQRPRSTGDCRAGGRR